MQNKSLRIIFNNYIPFAFLASSIYIQYMTPMLVGMIIEIGLFSVNLFIPNKNSCWLLHYTPEYPVSYSGYNNITRSTTQELETHDTWLWHHCTTRVAGASGAPVGRYFNHALATLSQISVIMADMVKCMINIDLHFVLPCGQEEIFCWVHKWNFWNICCRKLAVSDFFTNSKIHVSRWNWATLAIVIIQM